MTSSTRSGDFTYDVALSFAGEQRSYVKQVAAALRRRGIRPFYDDYEQATLWGKDLYEHLDWVYQKSARYCVLFASEAYARKVWTTHERRSAQARALTSNQEYVLPVRFDNTEIPGLRPTITYVDGLTTRPAKLAELIAAKLGPRVRETFFPPEPDKLFDALGVDTLAEQDTVQTIAHSFMQSLIRMTAAERKLVAHLFAQGCRTQLPDNIHIDLDIVRRDLHLAPTEIVERVRALASLGFEHEVRPDADHDDDDVLVVRWSDMIRHDEGSFAEDFSFERATEVAVAMLDVGSGDYGCRQCAEQCVESLDFSLLSSATSGPAT
ncbi:MAG: TIR domain-containing protein [Actinomycetota bacterium]|nr:TIR domain-containing protein [Actinomycetota bacterium]